ncbi:MAG: hypothetical protein COV07_02945 [Candidatus Vogelbacteria bacterium CG10_big_fil_rev_8_21_14_0_10_45_14]|uniref:Uncharacterized protein n=1 Tax=Candidatus Vogelbacteria bacterium CG10_big_fil_rev_8_21_14_0_10_45_14 TaxID=1975042 RepID=A0A2H0RJD4_9BACT|nr:MAG: hypothetical protein COV07_02945 [Candidatus Vogelbacteria bacterium CG10_big_fil_rev_8_21_14_0_10_45_14]
MWESIKISWRDFGNSSTMLERVRYCLFVILKLALFPVNSVLFIQGNHASRLDMFLGVLQIFSIVAIALFIATKR